MKTIFLLLFVIVTCILFGGSFYSSQVVEPLWSSDPPASLHEYGHIVMLAGSNFFRFITPLAGLLSLITLATSFRTAKPHFWWRISASVVFLAAFVWSVLYFVPTAMFLSSPGVDSISNQEAVQMTQDWVRNDSIRMVLVAIALVCGIRALFVPSKKSEEIAEKV